MKILKYIRSPRGGRPGYASYRNPTAAGVSCEQHHWISEPLSLQSGVWKPGVGRGWESLSSAPCCFLSLLPQLGGPVSHELPGQVSAIGLSSFCLYRQELKTHEKDASHRLRRSLFPSVPKTHHTDRRSHLSSIAATPGHQRPAQPPHTHEDRGTNAAPFSPQTNEPIIVVGLGVKEWPLQKI